MQITLLPYARRKPYLHRPVQAEKPPRFIPKPRSWTNSIESSKSAVHAPYIEEYGDNIFHWKCRRVVLIPFKTISRSASLASLIEVCASLLLSRDNTSTIPLMALLLGERRFLHLRGKVNSFLPREYICGREQTYYHTKQKLQAILYSTKEK